MEIIAIAPVPQQNTSSQAPTEAAGDGGSGFRSFLEQAVSPGSSDGQADADAGNRQQQTADDLETTVLTEQPGQDQQQPALIADDPAETIVFLAPPVMTEPGLLSTLFERLTGQALHVNGGLQTAPPAPPVSPAVTPEIVTTAMSGERPATANPATFPWLTITAPDGKTTMPTVSPRQSSSAMLTQLQQLITGHQDQVTVTASFQPHQQRGLPGFLTGTLVVQAHGETVPSPVTAPSAVQQAVIGGDPGVQVKLEPVTTSLRQDNPGQELTGKINLVHQNAGQEQKNNGAGQQSTAQHQQNTAGRQTITTLPPLGEQSATPGGFTAQFQEISQQQLDAARFPTAAAPSPAGQHILEKNVIDQIIQRFSLQTHLQTSKISLKLHPAELGELKIDVVVKQDSLKANIYAQTRQAQEIIEKHLPRLRTLLEEQGLLVEDLLVTLESDSLEDFSRRQHHSFGEQLADFNRDRNQNPSNAFDQSFEEEITLDAQEPAGVNLTV